MYYPSYEYLQQLESRIQQLEAEKQNLKEKLEDIKPIHIENIHYKIQELSVQELKGTLNIGMTALSDPEEIKKWLNEAEGRREGGAESEGEGEDIQLSDMEQPIAKEEDH